MRPLSQLPFVQWTEPDSGEVKRLYADVIQAEAAQLPAIVTDHPVEVGSEITDHYRKEAESVSIKMYFTRNPLRGDLDDDSPGKTKHFAFNFPKYPPGAPIFTPGGLTQAIGGAVNSLTGGGDQQPSGYDALAFESPPSRFEKSVDLVRRFQSTGILCTFQTTVGRFENMAILLGSPHREDDGAAAGIMDLEARQIRFVASDIALAVPLPVEPRGQKKGDNSANGADSVDGEEASVAKKAANGWGLTQAGSGL
jgi:hypothetical protein